MKIVALSLALVLFTHSASAQEPKPCIDAKLKAQIQKLILDAIDSAFASHIMALFQVWLKENDIGSNRAGKGMIRGIDAYNRARQNALNWNPTVCEDNNVMPK